MDCFTPRFTGGLIPHSGKQILSPSKAPDIFGAVGQYTPQDYMISTPPLEPKSIGWTNNLMEPGLNCSVSTDLSFSRNTEPPRRLESCRDPNSKELLNLRAPYSETHSQRRRKRGRLHDCPESSCNHRQFSDKAGLKRHLREFHGSGVYYCPYASCKRHSRGFPRKYNLLQHQKRCHGNILETLPEESTPQSSSVRLLEYSNSLMKPRDLLEERFNSSDNQLGIGSLSQWGQDLKGEDRIWKKIQELRSIRAEINQEIDRDMETLEGALGLMSDSDSLPDSFSAKGTSNRNGAPVSTRPSFAIQAPKRAFSSPDSAILSRTKSSPYNRIPPSSPMSMMETDWESDSDSGDGTYNILSNSSRAPLKGGDDQENRNGIILSPSKQASIDRIMDEFYVMFNQEWMPSFKKAPGSSDTASSQSPSQSSRASSGKSQSSRQTKRKRGVDEGSPNDDDSNDPKKPELSSTAFDTPSSGLQFACPYYKRYPERYGLHHESKNPKHKSCALKKFPSIARMKAHLYSRHRVPLQCNRCWLQFPDQAQLEAHMRVDSAEICQLHEPSPLEGITPELEQRVRSRKKSYPGQSEGAIWRDIFGILFPNQGVPSPFHDPIQYITAASPDSKAVAEYEEFRAQRLPGLFQSRVEAMITQPGKTEDSILRHLTDIILDCSGELYALYRSTHKVASDALSLMTMPEASQGNLFPASGINDLGCPGFAAVTDPYGTLNYTSPYFSSHPAGCQTTPTFEDAQQRAAKAGRIQHQHLSLATAQNKPNINIFAPDFTNNEGTSLEPTSQDKTRWIDNMCTAVGIDENDQPGHCHQQPPFQHRATASCPDFNIGSRLKRCTASFTPDLTTYRPQTLEQIRHQARGNEQKDHHTSAYTENSFWYGDLTNIDGTKQVDYQTSMGNVESLSLPNPEDFDFSNWEEICH